LVNGEAVGAINRRPLPSEFARQPGRGREPEATTLTTAERAICAELAPAFRRRICFFVAVDVIGDAAQ